MATEVRDQSQLDAALKASKPGEIIACIGDGWFRVTGTSRVEARDSAHVEAWGSAHVVARDSAHVEAWDSAHVVAWGSAHVVARDSAHVVAWDSAHVVAWSSAHVEARDSAHVVARDSAHVVARDSAHVVAWDSAHVVAWDSAHVVAWSSAHVVAWGSAHVEARDSAHVVARDSAHVEARDSAHVVAWGSAHVEARGSAHVVAWSSAHVVASKYVSVTQDKRGFNKSKVEGGVLVEIPPITNAADWCAFYGVEPTLDGLVTLFKAVDDDYSTENARRVGIAYTPGSQPAAPDWDGGQAECGGGLHFAAHTGYARDFNADATRYVACPVLLSEIVVHSPAVHPQKIKAPRVAAPIWEVDRTGKALAPPAKPKRTRKATT